MNFTPAGYSLLPVLPEIVLAVGAMVLLMLGAYRGQRATPLVVGLAIGLLIVTGVLELCLPAGKLVTFGGSFVVDSYARFLKVEAENALERTNKKFIRRFQAMENMAEKEGKQLADMSHAEMDSYWNPANEKEKQISPQQ